MARELEKQGIIHRITYPRILEQNEFMESRHRKIVERGLVMLHKVGIPNDYWSYAFKTTVYYSRGYLQRSLMDYHPLMCSTKENQCTLVSKYLKAYVFYVSMYITQINLTLNLLPMCS